MRPPTTAPPGPNIDPIIAPVPAPERKPPTFSGAPMWSASMPAPRPAAPMPKPALLNPENLPPAPPGAGPPGPPGPPPGPPKPGFITITLTGGPRPSIFFAEPSASFAPPIIARAPFRKSGNFPKTPLIKPNTFCRSSNAGDKLITSCFPSIASSSNKLRPVANASLKFVCSSLCSSTAAPAFIIADNCSLFNPAAFAMASFWKVFSESKSPIAPCN